MGLREDRPADKPLLDIFASMIVERDSQKGIVIGHRGSRLRDIGEIESCWSVAGEESYILKVRVGTPLDLEDLLARIRSAANVATRTTIVLSTPYENRPVG